MTKKLKGKNHHPAPKEKKGPNNSQVQTKNLETWKKLFAKKKIVFYTMQFIMQKPHNS